MFEVPRDDNTASPKQNESGPNYFAYYKHLVLDLLSENGTCFIPFTEADSIGESEGSHNDDKGRKLNYFCGAYFSEAIADGLSEFKKERVLATLNESATCFNREVDEMLDHILAAFQIDSNLRERVQSPSNLNAALDEDEDLSMPLNNKKRKAHSNKSNYSGRNSTSVAQVYNNIQALQGKDEICHEDVEKYTFHLLKKLDKMEENLEDYLNVVMSKCRPMTRIEKHRLGKTIRKLPEKALDRAVEILQPSNFSAKDLPEKIFVDLEKQDNVKLWRLYYYVELVVQASKL